MDNGSPPLSASVQCHVTILDLNDNQPQFEKSVYRLSVYENETKSTALLQVGFIVVPWFYVLYSKIGKLPFMVSGEFPRPPPPPSKIAPRFRR